MNKLLKGSISKIMKTVIFLLFLLYTTAMKAQNESVKTQAQNVLGEPLQVCSVDPLTGYFRDGYCHTNLRDYGTHVVSAVMTDEFLTYTATCGNDLTTPNAKFSFPGLKPGDRWCLCISRWVEAERAGVAPPVHLESTEISALKFTTLDKLKEYAIPRQ